MTKRQKLASVFAAALAVSALAAAPASASPRPEWGGWLDRERTRNGAVTHCLVADHYGRSAVRVVPIEDVWHPTRPADRCDAYADGEVWLLRR